MAAKLKKGLGRGLGALIKEDVKVDVKPDVKPEDSGGETLVPVDQVKKNTFQPRQQFDQDALAELSASIKEHGVLQPLLVRMADEGYELIAGERRLRASIDVGLTHVPAIIVKADDSVAAELALVENLQREDLNILEEAEGYQRLADEFDLTQEQIADRVGKARASVSNAIRLLGLPDEVKRLMSQGEISAGHAKLLIGLDIEQEQIMMARRSVKEAISVRGLEKMIKKLKQGTKKPRAAREDVPRDHLSHLSDKLHTHFGTSVRITPSRTYANGKKGKGSIEIDYFSNDDLDRVLSLMGIDLE